VNYQYPLAFEQALKATFLGSINNSLTTLRRCIKQLRDNQKRGRRDHVPYRDSQITKMFGSFFDGKPGNGTLRMMVCINPRASDFDENVNIMEFAETAQKIQIERVEPIPRELFTPGRTLGNKAYSEALRREREANTPSVNPTNSVYSPIYSLGPDWPPLEVGRCDDEETLENLEHYLMKRVATRNTLIEDHNNQVEQFRARLVEAEQRIALLDNENMKLKHGGDGERRRVRDLETRLVNAEAANNSLQKKNTALNEAKSVLEKELDDKELLINNNKKNQKRSARKLQSQLSEQEAINNDLAHKLLEEEAKKDRQMYDRARLRAVRSIVGDKNPALLNKTLSDPNMSTVGKENTPWKRKPMSSAKSNPNVTLTPAHPRRVN
jgi:kinesin family protein 23